MLVPAERFTNTPVMSLQTGSELARTSREIIDPRNLTVVAYELQGALLDKTPTLLLIDDVREIGPLGMIIDSVDELVDPDDIVRIKQIYDYQFALTQKSVIDEKKHNVGKVIGYTLEAKNFMIQQLRVRRPFLKSLGDTELLIHRSQVLKVTDDKIIVHMPTIRHKDPVSTEQSARAVFDNPFRKTSQPETKTVDR